MNKRAEYIYQLIGKVIEKRAKKKKDGTTFYQLSTVIPDKEQVKKINVFADSAKEKVWENIETNNYHQKEYVFFCKNYMGNYYLVDWKELNNSFFERAKELTNHGNRTN